MGDATTELRRALHQTLSGDAMLTGMLAAGGIFDRPPAGTMPFLVHGPWRSDDYSTGTETSEEHWLTLEIWTDTGGQKTGLAIAARLRRLLDNQPLSLPTIRLVSLLYRTTRTRRAPGARALVCEIGFRAVTEG